MCNKEVSISVVPFSLVSPKTSGLISRLFNYTVSTVYVNSVEWQVNSRIMYKE